MFNPKSFQNGLRRRRNIQPAKPYGQHGRRRPRYSRAPGTPSDDDPAPIETLQYERNEWGDLVMEAGPSFSSQVNTKYRETWTVIEESSDGEEPAPDVVLDWVDSDSDAEIAKEPEKRNTLSRQRDVLGDDVPWMFGQGAEERITSPGVSVRTAEAEGAGELSSGCLCGLQAARE
ncbi:hypothetical protein BDZ89DRAFT_1141541 [Hymenopellis radicata]|nr:hypothetical protein BDZ89DRAFT_1141541 [Hymenopellis radicata]